MDLAHLHANAVEKVRDQIRGRGQPAARLLSDAQIADFKRDGFVCVRAADMWDLPEFDALLDGVNIMDEWPERKGEYMKYFERNRRRDEPGHEHEPEKILTRIEKFVEYNPTIDSVLRGEKVLKMVGQLFDDEAVLHKEKVNYKLPGGDKFDAHQDYAAGWWLYGQSNHISVLMCIDPANRKNGCLELVRARHKEGLFCPQWAPLSDEVCATMDWEVYETEPGDIVFFDAFVPHRSGPNNTDTRRRIVYATYSMKREGEWREKYFQDKRAALPPDIEREAGKEYKYRV